MPSAAAPAVVTLSDMIDTAPVLLDARIPAALSPLVLIVILYALQTVLQRNAGALF